MSETRTRAKYTLEFKMEAVRLVKGGQAVSVTAKELGIPKASLDNWVRLSAKGQLKGAEDKPVSAEQMELAQVNPEHFEYVIRGLVERQAHRSEVFQITCAGQAANAKYPRSECCTSGTRYVDAWCHRPDALRRFALDGFEEPS